MSYIPHTAEDRASMLTAIGVKSTDELFHDVGAQLLELPGQQRAAQVFTLTGVSLVAHGDDGCADWVHIILRVKGGRNQYSIGLFSNQGVALVQVRCCRSGIIGSNDSGTGGAMTAEETMTLSEKWKVLRQIKPAYLKAGRTEQSQKLGHLEETLGMHRKSIIRRIHSDLRRRPRKRERGPK